MRRTGYFRMMVFFIWVLFFGSISVAESSIPKTWTEITPGPTTFMGRELNPTCSGAPGTDPAFKFFVKGGAAQQPGDLF